MKVLVTGASGFIGRPLIKSLAADHEVWAVARSLGPPLPAARWVQWDMTMPLPAHVLPARLDAVIHLAQSRDYRAFPEKALAIARVNVSATLDLLDHALQAGARKFVFASSGGVYGGSSAPIKEDARVRPPDYYLSTKLAAETLARSYRSLFHVVILRPFFVYGRGQSPDRFVAQLVRRVFTGEAVILYGAEGIRVNPIHVEDVAKAFHRALALEGSYVLNVAGPDVLTLRRMVELIGVNVGRAPVFEQLPPDPQRDLVGDPSEMVRRLGGPVVRFENRISEVCDEVLGALT